ncbi:MAG: hypothetical protein AAGK01_03065 [Pseudomonadota bacterium]
MLSILSNPLLTSWANSFLGLLGFLLVLPVAAAHLSAPQFTLWLFGNSIIAVGILFETSVSVVFTRVLTSNIERRSQAPYIRLQGSPDRIAEFVCTSFVLYVVVGFVGSLASYGAGAVSVGGLIVIGLDSDEAFFTLLAVGAIAYSSIVLSFGRSVLIANQQLRIQRVIMLLTTSGKLLITIIVFATLERVDVAMAAIAVLNIAEIALVTALSWALHRLALQARPNLRAMDEFTIPFLKTFVIRIGGYLTMYSSSIIIVRYVPADADAYLLSFRLVQAAASVSIIPVSISLPALTRLRARIRELGQPPSAFVEAVLPIIVFAVLCMMLMLLGLLLLGPWMLELAANGKTLLGRPALAYLCLIFLLESHHVAHSMVYETQNRVPFLAISIVSGAAMLGLSMVLVPRFGIWGALVALNLVQIAANNWVPVWLNLRQWGMSWTTYLGKVAHLAFCPSLSGALDPDA